MIGSQRAARGLELTLRSRAPMPTPARLLTPTELKRFAKSPVKCSRLRQRITSLADFLAVISDAIRTEEPFWFRGHEDVTFSLTPTALRFSALSNRTRALGLMADFKRVAQLKLASSSTRKGVGVGSNRATLRFAK